MESAMRICEFGKPFWAMSSSSRDAVCKETWKRAGSDKARGHQDVTKGLELALGSVG